MVTRIRDVLELTNGELCVLRWLRISNGKATLSASVVAKNSLFIVPPPLLQAGYVRVGTDPYNPKTVHYTLTVSGLEALELNERMALTDLAKRRRSRAGIALDRFKRPLAPVRR